LQRSGTGVSPVYSEIIHAKNARRLCHCHCLTLRPAAMTDWHN